MPLPEAKPDRRIYELLKNVDLENLTFNDLQAVGQKIFAEQGAEDELRRLVLVNLARLSVAGEWNGLTTFGGGSSGILGTFPNLAGITPTAGGELVQSNVFPTGYWNGGFDTLTSWQTYYYYAPFVIPQTKTYTEATIRCSTGAANNELTAVLYSATSDRAIPETKIATATFDCSTSGIKTVSWVVEPGQSLDLTKGALMWLAFKATGTSFTAQVLAFEHDENFTLGMNFNAPTAFFDYNIIVSFNAPSTFATSDIVSTFSKDTIFLSMD